MALQDRAKMIFTRYEVQDAGVLIYFICDNPGPGQESEYFVLLTDDEVIAIGQGGDFLTIGKDKLSRKYRNDKVADVLDKYLNLETII